ncbi:hydrophobin 2 [Boletus coccyginus]|nr:hydrophobin 2 [Boletus coccyginus]
MFARLATLVPVAALVAVVTAAPNGSGGSVSQCNTSDQYCCDSAITQYTSAVSGVLGVLNGLNLAGDITCSPISVIGFPSSGCAQNPVCCTSNNFNGVANVGCSPLGPML